LSEDTLKYFFVSTIAERWAVSDKKAARILEQFRGQSGFLDLGAPDRLHRRKYSILRISPALLIQIENQRRTK
jgi:hypothetical protein